MRSKAIGVDSDSLGAVCVLVDTSVSRVVVQEYAITDEALGRFVKWIGQYPDAVVALEGHHGHNKPFEGALRRAALPFHSFSAFGAMMSPDLPLRREQHEMIAAMVSITNRCFY